MDTSAPINSINDANEIRLPTITKLDLTFSVISDTCSLSVVSLREVIISNTSQDVYSVRSEEVFLINDGQVIYPISGSRLDLPEDIKGYFQFLGLKDLVINPGESKHGFLYFRFPRGEESFPASAIWSTDYKLRLGARKISKDTGTEEDRNRLVYTIILRNF